MRVLVCGGRYFRDELFVDEFLTEMHELQKFTAVIEGEARGVDKMAKRWALRNSIPVEMYLANWNEYGSSAAGPIRNREMLQKGKPELVIAFPGGRGTSNMIKAANKAFVPVIEPVYPKPKGG